MYGLYVFASLAFVVITMMVFVKQRSPLFAGGMAIPVAAASCAAPSNGTYSGSAWLIVVLVAVSMLFLIGYFKPVKNSWKWHWAAFGLATLGLLLVHLVPMAWGALPETDGTTGKVTAAIVLGAVAILLGIIATTKPSTETTYEEPEPAT